MSQENPQPFDLTRRKVLGGLSAVGIASVGAGLGTSAYFSDQETYEGNQLVAGSLDLKVDWEEHYSDWSEDEEVTYTVDDEEQSGVRMEEPPDEESGDWHGMPSPDEPLIWVHDDAMEDFMAATALEAYPDDGDNGSQSLHRYAKENYCDILADTPEDLDPNTSDPARTLNDDTVLENGDPAPLINLDDVKPGDFGEVTFSFHLCDNPGYVWMNGGVVDASENGLTEPERKDPDEEDGRVELLDQVQTLLWYDDNGDNIYQPGGEGGPADVMLVIDTSGSLSDTDLQSEKDAATTLIDELGDGAQVGVTSFATDATVQQSMTGDKTSAKDSVQNDIPDTPNGATDHAEAIAVAQNELDANGRDDARDIMVILTDGETNDQDDDGYASASQEAQDARDAGTEIFAVGFGDVILSTLEDFASEPVMDHAFLSDDIDQLEQIFSQIGAIIAGEECFFRGTLRELATVLGDGNGIPLDGDRGTQFDEAPNYAPDVDAPSDPTADERECFVPAMNNYIGFAWWLPVDHGNEVQTDQVTFDIGFYTEQCRHNSGAGMDPQQTPTQTPQT